MTPPKSETTATPKPRKKYVPAVGPKLKKLLAVVFVLFAILVMNSLYMVSITVAGEEYQNRFYLSMFGVHLVLGLAIVVPTIIFGIIHIRNTKNRPNKRAMRAGYALFISAIILFVSGLLLTQVEVFGITPSQLLPGTRSISYWAHVICPLVAIWLFVLHRLAGRRIKWKVGLTWGAVAAAVAVAGVLAHRLDPQSWNRIGPAEGEKYFFPSLARTSTGDFIDADILQNDEYCLECHADIHESWSHSVHRFSSFNNPPYAFSVKETRQAMFARDGNTNGSRFCAGCHDPVPFFSGAFDDDRWDDPDYDLASDPMANAGITCTVCHAITNVNSHRGNADFTITEPEHYPFAFSDQPALKWINRQLIKAKPAFHKATFLKPLHGTAEFCGTCHKVHLPEELNDYKWLRGQNHYDSWRLSGVSGRGLTSFYYPAKAEDDCNGCHMPQRMVANLENNFGAHARGPNGEMMTMDHQFPSANTAIPAMVGNAMSDPDGAIAAHQAFNEGVTRVDLFALRADGRIDGELIGPIGDTPPTLVAGESYLLETVVRTLKVGHLLTQGTADSNEIWLDIEVRSGDRIVGRSGGMADNGEVDPWSHFLNAFVLDRNGNRIDRRNAEDIFVALYNNQIPPGAAASVHYGLEVPNDITEPLTVTARLRYRKFDQLYMELVTGDPLAASRLPILEFAETSVTFPVQTAAGDVVSSTGDGANESSGDSSSWQRWNDYGIALLRAMASCVRRSMRSSQG